ncbi:MAG: tRNA uracil 4-sulfurtransferase ThiI [Sphaerochaetaceae bacterium]|jgi:thiamine biosynthesis protein ThiI|nr:tRNA 4-thiouridine(8) synthase ThiI [Sphaerochaetaceae bacterium]MDD3942798.1 tRNA 4-thiouridine(8) synthase ThiI [Sphaerochaetaceae bacterium]MDX9938595.1 tRNA uracil 4-sulfurtransferase ThiI [Sphaerochaetaceae bacterium]
MDMTLYLVRLGEISLKGLNRDFFERKLKDNIKYKLRPYRNRFTKQKGRLFIEVDRDAPEDLVRRAISTSFGVVGFSQAIQCAKDMDAISEAAARLTSRPSFLSGTRTFKVETVRADKSFPLKSYDISGQLGHEILTAHEQLRVDVHQPDRILHVEIRDHAYLYASPESGPGGLPVGTAGRGMLMLSGGIDSPVAAYRMAKRGLRQEAVYFHAYPYTSDEAKEKVLALAKILSPYCSGITVHVVPFTDVQLHIKTHSMEEENTLLMRACMMKIANELARRRDCLAIVTGESLSQVASQTLESLAFTNSMSDLPVFRPLIGMDKQEIVQTSRMIGTYETSILPYEDCCTIFSPKHPLVRPDMQKLTESYARMHIEPLLSQAIEDSEMHAL